MEAQERRAGVRESETTAAVLQDGILPTFLSSGGGLLIGMGIGVGPRADPPWLLFLIGALMISGALLIGLLASKHKMERSARSLLQTPPQV